MPNGRCRLHGGKSLAGAAHPGFQDGLYSKHLPVRLAARYEEAQADAELTALRDELALIDAGINDLLLRVDSGEAGEVWRELRRVADAYRSTSDEDDRATRILEMLDLIDRGATDTQAWAEVMACVERRRLVESELKRIVFLKNYLTPEKAMVLCGAVLAVIREHVHDQGTLSAIGRGVSALTDSFDRD